MEGRPIVTLVHWAYLVNLKVHADNSGGPALPRLELGEAVTRTSSYARRNADAAAGFA